MAKKSSPKISNDSKLEIDKYNSNTFMSNVITDCALACIGYKLDSTNALQNGKDGLMALETQGGLQTMLASQLMAVHKMQQTSIALANLAKDIRFKQYYTNTAIKLSNTFVQQASLLAKLQGMGCQKIIVEKVDVQSGGQAVVGIVNKA